MSFMLSHLGDYTAVRRHHDTHKVKTKMLIFALYRWIYCDTIASSQRMDMINQTKRPLQRPFSCVQIHGYAPNPEYSATSVVGQQ